MVVRWPETVEKDHVHQPRHTHHKIDKRDRAGERPAKGSLEELFWRCSRRERKWIRSA